MANERMIQEYHNIDQAQKSAAKGLGKWGKRASLWDAFGGKLGGLLLMGSPIPLPSSVKFAIGDWLGGGLGRKLAGDPKYDKVEGADWMTDAFRIAPEREAKEAFAMKNITDQFTNILQGLTWSGSGNPIKGWKEQTADMGGWDFSKWIKE